MAVKGFYFSLDAIMGLMLMGLAASLLVVSAQNTGLSSQDLRYSQYTGQANDVANLIQREKILDMDQRFEINSTRESETVASAAAKFYLEGNEDIAGNISKVYLDNFRYNTTLYIEDSGLQALNHEYNFSTASSSTFIVDGGEPVRMVAVVGE